MRARTTQSTWDTYHCPDCPTSLPTLDTLQKHYQTTHDPDWTAGYPSNCHQCGTTHKRKDQYDYKRAERHFCGSSCFRTWQTEVDDTARDNPNTTAGNPITTECAYCGTSMTREKYKIERVTNRHFCDNNCQGNYRAEHCSGQNHPDWDGGTAFYPAVSTLLSDNTWNEISETARETQPECEMCGQTDGDGRGRQNHVHHIVPILAGGTHHEDLLMTLCPTCHGTVERYINDIYGMERVVIPEERRNSSSTPDNAHPDDTNEESKANTANADD